MCTRTTLLLTCLGLIAAPAHAQWRGERPARDEVALQVLFPTGPLERYFDGRAATGLSWTHRLTDPPSMGLGRTIFFDAAATTEPYDYYGYNPRSRNFIAAGFGVLGSQRIGTEGTTLTFGAGLGWYGLFSEDGIFTSIDKSGALARFTVGAQVTGRIILEGAYFRGLTSQNPLEGVGLRLGYRF